MLNTDLPITKASEDMLNRQTFAASLARAILDHNSPDPFTIGLHGKWGSGKTSVINMMVESITAMSGDNDVVVLQFNPWLCTDPKQLITQFLKQLSSAIKLKSPSGAKVWSAIDQYADAFSFSSLIVNPLVGAMVSTMSGLFKRKAKSKVAAQSPDLQHEKDRIAQKLQEDNLKIVVTIDDIDRLSEPEIIAVFQLVKSLADFPHMFYVLAFDYDVVVKALSEVQKGDGREYLEKIIQVPFELPAPDMESIYQVLFQRLDKILADSQDNNWDESIWPELFYFDIKPYIQTLRDVIRYANVFSLKYDLLKAETDVLDLLGLTCLQVFEASIYSSLPFYKDALCGSYSQGIDSYDYEKKKTDTALEDIISNNVVNQDAAKRVLEVLFPKISSSNNRWFNHGRVYDHQLFLARNNIAHPYCFGRYFSLSLEADAIPSAFIENFAFHADTGSLIADLQKINQDRKIVRLLESIRVCAEGKHGVPLPPDRATMLLTTLLSQAHTLNDDNSSSFFDIPMPRRIAFCANSLITIIPSTSRYLLIEQLFSDRAIPLNTIIPLLQSFEHQHGRFTTDSNASSSAAPKAFTLEEVQALEEVTKMRILEMLDAGTLLSEKYPLKPLWLLEQLDPDLASEKESQLITDDNSLVKVVCSCVSRGRMILPSARPTWDFLPEELVKFIPPDEAYARICNYVKTSAFSALPHDTQEDIAAFLLATEHPKDGNDIERSISAKDIANKLAQLGTQGN